MSYRTPPQRIALYQKTLTLMFKLSPELIHGIISRGVSLVQNIPPLRWILAKMVRVNDPILAQEVFGTVFPLPLGLAAGFDKDGLAPDAWEALGFGFSELGTVTASPQPGNPQPRLFRLPKDHAILNRMGFNNTGATEVAKNLRRRSAASIIGINIGKTKVVEPEEAADDYRRSASLLGDLADYVVVNVSSPNTPGLRDLQAVDSLRPILSAVKAATSTPVLVKIAPDLNDADIDAIADLASELDLDGIVATNTTISREGLSTDASIVEDMGAGGISGPPVAARSLDVLRRLHQKVGDEMVLIGVGGIESARQAWERIAAGATLIQGYTGLIYGGPDWIREIHRGLAEQLRAHNLASLSEAVGSGLPWTLD
ncbi:quinone-dependent dihydroorotate dehydrogenase [Corynebacterium sp. ES2794-CONJ1]|uniref:quinone-dependent dihydroorotate dehydrogenase n=1 Tax=unclassified Corynebacterium TaxID=2624378 RepID=UPI002167AA0B|nr:MULTISPECIES: quinone-dependent dihydroorotate dehydrogenase [unclassified Corynebacterium]MCS4489328.1 quinone-dependent dihydroorotate dehydrogenase [Corynebacterium sp. ES2775-CONJ]MCS4530978.1 quinone-dependent dihydroorotate dehydrogenase [Corynebacterium sp. ES2730-CONJ]MCU9518345.1 quinone-dependent dihydroorotate dehydrogenase [Corynebacterium sp. ES2794-CONJ1]